MPSAERVLISLSDKNGAVESAQALHKPGVGILSTGGTAKLLTDAGVPVIRVANYTGFPETLDGRVKTLHPKVRDGTLGRRGLDEHVAKMEGHSTGNTDLVCVNLYPFAATIAKPDYTLENTIENIDIGGPTMMRSTTRNWKHVAIVTDTANFPVIAAEAKANGGTLSDKIRFNLSRKAFSHTVQHDGMTSDYLTSLSDDVLNGMPEIGEFPGQFSQSWVKVQDMRYGESPHQRTVFYRDVCPIAGSLAACKQLQGRELSYNNIVDANAAWEAIKSFDAPTRVIVKHANPCGVAVAADILTAYKLAYAIDTTNTFGGIIAFNREVDDETMEQITDDQFMEVLMTPKFTAEAFEIAAAKKNVHVLEVPLEAGANRFELKHVGGRLLVQTPDTHRISRTDLKVVSKRQPTRQEWNDLLFVWDVAKYVEPNAIVFGKGGRTYGIDTDQTSRVDSTRIAAHKAQDADLDLNGACATPDAFFPFRGGVDVVTKQGIKAIIYLASSIRDREVFDAADEHGVAMVVTDVRHLRH